VVVFILLISIGFGVLFSAILDAIFKLPDRNFVFYLQGITWYGMMIGGTSTFVALYKLAIFLHKKYKVKIFRIETPLREYLNFLGFAMPLGHAAGRLGCFFVGCCYGTVDTSSVFGILPQYGAALWHRYGEVAIFPIQLFEAFGLLCIFAFNFFIKPFKKEPHEFRHPNAIIRYDKFANGVQNHRMGIYFVGYAVLRFILEFFRDDFRGGLFGYLSPAQFVSILIVVFFGGLYSAHYLWQKKAVSNECNSILEKEIELKETNKENEANEKSDE